MLKLENIKQKSWFVLPPLMEYYFKKKNPFYKSLPKYRVDCLGDSKNAMKFIYPTENSTIFLPKDFEGKKNEVVFRVAHSNSEATLFWYVDNIYCGTTKRTYDFSMNLEIGTYTISVTDNFGGVIAQKISVTE